MELLDVANLHAGQGFTDLFLTDCMFFEPLQEIIE